MFETEIFQSCRFDIFKNSPNFSSDEISMDQNICKDAWTINSFYYWHELFDGCERDQLQASRVIPVILKHITSDGSHSPANATICTALNSNPSSVYHNDVTNFSPMHAQMRVVNVERGHRGRRNSYSSVTHVTSCQHFEGVNCNAFREDRFERFIRSIEIVCKD